MKQRFITISLLVALFATPMFAQTRVIVRTTSLLSLNSACLLLGCKVNYGLGDPQGQLFLVTSNTLNLSTLIGDIKLQLGVLSIEVDTSGRISQTASSPAPSGLSDRTPVSYYGTSAWHGYVAQPAASIIKLPKTQTTYGATGAGIVAIIDTGIDPTQPVLSKVLLPGYDFTRNQNGASELNDVSLSPSINSGTQSANVNQSSAAVLDQSSAAVLDGSQSYSTFGHGTMVAGIVHLVAPTTKLLPLKAFNADGSGYLSDVLRGIYKSVQSNANVINMSFSFSSYSKELNTAVSYANNKGVICVASAGNSGTNAQTYPAALSGIAMGVASTTNNDALSFFSNYGSWIWVGAPGEGVITTYPYGSYAAVWGTSFSAPQVAGAAALLLSVQSCTESPAASAIGHAKWISSALGNGRLDTYQAVTAWRQALGLQ